MSKSIPGPPHPASIRPDPAPDRPRRPIATAEVPRAEPATGVPCRKSEETAATAVPPWGREDREPAARGPPFDAASSDRRSSMHSIGGGPKLGPTAVAPAIASIAGNDPGSVAAIPEPPRRRCLDAIPRIPPTPVGNSGLCSPRPPAPRPNRPGSPRSKDPMERSPTRHKARFDSRVPKRQKGREYRLLPHRVHIEALGGRRHRRWHRHAGHRRHRSGDSACGPHDLIRERRIATSACPHPHRRLRTGAWRNLFLTAPIVRLVDSNRDGVLDQEVAEDRLWRSDGTESGTASIAMGELAAAFGREQFAVGDSAVRPS